MTEWVDTHTDPGRCAAPATVAIRGALAWNPGVRPTTCQQLDHLLEDHSTLERAHQPLEAVRDDPSRPLAHRVLCLRPSPLALLTRGPRSHQNRAWEKPSRCPQLCWGDIREASATQAEVELPALRQFCSDHQLEEK